MLGSASDHQVQVYVSNGMVVHFTLRELRQMYLSWQVWVLITVGFFVMATGHPITLPQFDSFELRFLFWLVALLFYIALSEMYAKFFSQLWTRVFGRPVPLILISMPLVLACTYATGAILTVLFDPSRPPFQIMTWQMNVRNVLVAHAFETATLLWLIPAQRARGPQRKTGRVLTLAGGRMELANILRVKAAEHYLEIYGEDGLVTVRERMSTFLDQVEPEDGIQTHRSHWVAARHVQSLSTSELRLSDGEKVPVARGRVNEVRQWLAVREQATLAG